MGQPEEMITLLAKIRAEIGRSGESFVRRADWLVLCSHDLVSLGAVAAAEKWNYELVGDSTMKFTDTHTADSRTAEAVRGITPRLLI